MSAQTLSAEFIVLDRASSGDAWTRLTVFAALEGRLECMQRVTSKPSAAVPALDLFDSVRASMGSSNQGRTWFLREAQIVRRRTGLGASYASLQHACRFARVLARNPLHDESRDAVLALLERALDAWEAATRPDAVYFKSLFLLGRDEGFPVREEWMRGLTATDRTVVESILRRPSAAQVTEETDVRRMTGALEHYLAQDHDFVFPET